jgi:hypothetical protein
MNQKIKIKNVEYTSDNEVIVAISYSITFTDKTEVIIPGDKYSFIPVPDKTKEVFENVIYNKKLILAPPVENFIDFKDITEEILLGWVETYDDLDVLKAEAHKTIQTKLVGTKYKKF